MNIIELINTEDGSHSILNIELNETYHSDKGAIVESNHVYIENGLSLINKKSVNILEIGFGSGLNALLTFQFAKVNNLEINYFTIEKYPLSLAFIRQLNYPELLSFDNHLFEKMHQSLWNHQIELSKHFYLQKIHSDLINYDFNILPNIDLVYYDAFSPSKQPELWTEKIFRKIYNKLNTNALLTTYSSAGIVKRALRSVGYAVQRKQGAGGKFHMLNALKI